MNKYAGTIGFFIGGLLLSSVVFGGFWPRLIITAIATFIGWGFDLNRGEKS
jgi:hypothetical protein